MLWALVCFCLGHILHGPCCKSAWPWGSCCSLPCPDSQAYLGPVYAAWNQAWSREAKTQAWSGSLCQTTKMILMWLQTRLVEDSYKTTFLCMGVPGAPICPQPECQVNYLIPDIYTQSRLKPWEDRQCLSHNVIVIHCNGLPFLTFFFSGHFYPQGSYLPFPMSLVHYRTVSLANSLLGQKLAKRIIYQGRKWVQSSRIGNKGI